MRRRWAQQAPVIAFESQTRVPVGRSVNHLSSNKITGTAEQEALAWKYSIIPSNTGQSASPTGPRLKRRICAGRGSGWPSTFIVQCTAWPPGTCSSPVLEPLK